MCEYMQGGMKGSQKLVLNYKLKKEVKQEGTTFHKLALFALQTLLASLAGRSRV